ncbi:multidrug effflux MFS transporter [Microbulbifer hydrolyticus]|uniref:Bcr/CflA family efflux transporter n=1 Tax=Microbulbifer hydrolyticus TaxID=48074 RepID=A0A6P1T483_9GAMM|nr:multidrug effflux MFS transporter [Microbulbifer hydrolyticus]MBB5211713.1 DHA1 family bicyclomycin/chloramphenicol resistance-like MFS transporter [Microbulbifer hydrolyticus]QHQ37558.1 Bcr/CflA family efflux MFS transporter [Microbulbifer hydrolyticus]
MPPNFFDANGKPPRWLAPCLAALVALTPFAIDTYLPAIPAMAAALGVDVAQVQHSVSSYLLGFAVGQIFGGPLSDRWGRILVGTIGLSIFILSTALILLVNNVELLVALRFFQAVGGGFATVICGAIVRDLYHGREAARIMSMIATMMLIAPMVAPVIGSTLLTFGDWHAIFIFLLVYGVLMMVLVRGILPETVSRFRRARRQRQSRRSMIGGYAQIFRCRRALGFLFGQAFVSGCMFIYITTAPFVFMEHFGVSSHNFPILFGSCVLGLVVLVQLNIRLLKVFEPRQILVAGVGLQVVSCALLLTSTLYFGDQQPLLAWMIPLVMAMGAIGIITPNSAACYLEFFPNISGTANALFGASLFIFGGVLGGAVNAVHTGTLVPIAVGMLCCSAAALCLVLFVARARQPIGIEERVK